MSKQEILGWTQRIEQEDEDDEHAPEFDWMTLEKDWSGFLLFAQHQILSSSTKRRIAFINGRLVPLALRGDLSMSQTMDIFGLVRMTLPRYVDNPSREAVMHLSEVLVRRDELRGREGGELDASKMGVAEQIIGWLNVEATRISQCPASVASLQISVLFSWACNLYSLIVKLTPGYQATPVWGKLGASIALLLDSLLDNSSPAKPALRKRSTVQARRTVLSSPESIPKLAELVCQAISGSNTKGIPFLGLIYDVATHLKLKEDSTELAGKIEGFLLKIYVDIVLSSKVAVPPHILAAYDGFIENAVSQENHELKILPVIEKMLLRSPEICLPTFTAFYTHYKQSLCDEELKRLLPPILSGTKSTNGIVRSGVIDLWLAITPLIISESGLKFSVDNILAPVLTGKTNGVDHRQALFKLIQHIPTGPQSREIIKGLIAQLEKETNESVLTCISEALPKHMVNVLKSGNHLEPPLLFIIGKEVASSKPPNRRAVMVVLGNIFWDAYQDPSAWTPGATELLETIYPTLEKILRDAPSSTMAPGANPVEAWIALVVLLSSPVTSAKSLPFVHSVVVPTGKPSFLYSEKVYQKVTDEVDILWLLRVINRVASAFSEEIVQQPRNELYYGQTLLWLVVDHPSSQVRRLSIETLRNKSGVSTIIYGSIKQAMEQILFDEKKYLGLSDPKHRSSRLSSALISSIPSPGESNLSVEPLLSELLLLSHHRIFAQLADNLWIELLQYAKLDPHGVVTRNFKQLITYAEDAVTGTDSGSLRNDAALRAITTLAFVAPELAVPHLLRKIKTLLDPTPLHALGELEMGVWKTPAGIPFVDVLASSKGNSGKDKGKDADIKKWEAELRKSLAQKKTAEPTLSKQEKALVDAQLQKEESIRTSLRDLKKRLLNGVSMISSLLQSGTADSREQSPFLASILMNGIVQRGSLLLGPRVISVFLDLFKSASERLQESRMWFGVATLRVYEVEEIPENLTEEPLNGLLGRLLYKLKGLSDQNPFDGATFSLLWPFIQKVVQKGGVGTESEDDAVEQLVLILDVIRSHTSQFAIPSYPRKDTCQLLVHVIGGHPRVSRDAISALLETGEAIHDSATAEEQDELINSTLNQEVFVRNACLQAMQSFDLTERDWVPILWLACHDEDDQNANLARRLWVENGLDVPDTFLDDMVPFLGHSNQYVRRSCALSLTESVEIWPVSIGKVLQILRSYYLEKAKILEPEYDQYGMVIPETLNRSDPWESRLAVADSLYHLAEQIPEIGVISLFKFLINEGAMGDRHGEVRRRMLEAGMSIIQLHGRSCLPGLISIFEDHLAMKESSSDSADHIRQAVVILLGSLAQHLQKADPRLTGVISRLIEALKTPSEIVQEAVADCLSPLAPLVEGEVGRLIDQLFSELTAGAKYASRRGAAYGIAGMIRGVGIAGIQKYNIIRRLREAAADKKSYESRQGASFALEMLAQILGRGFEPYVIQLLPVILTGFGDGNAEVREATIDASKIIMGKLSGYGVKQIMPKVIEGLEERQWRTKKGSVELLGSMAFCAPKQLSSALPTVVPQLTIVLTDSHAQVRAAGNKSLKQFGEVISNPEIHSLVSTLLKAMVDPEKTPVALNALLKKSFVHYIDAASLAIVIPIIERGLRERSAETKRKATQIVGQMAGLTDSKDFIPYLPRLLPLVHIVLVDPVPEARATAAKALGTLVERLGEGQFPDLVHDLLRTLRSDTSGVDRQGAAQGLSEVLSGLGMERLEGLLPDIISSASSPRAYVREGFMSLLVYLPATFGTRFQPHLSKIIPPILRGLADNEEYVREASMKAGRMIVVNYSSRAVDLLLPELEQGIFDPGWRIRQSSITLIGELLFRLSGISGKAELEEEEEADAVVAESSRKVLTEVLGKERRDRVLGALYLVRQDAVAAVRMASIHIWKALVSNTPRTVREILPTLINQVVDLLSMPHGDQRETAARTIGELCRKFGEKIIGDMLPILQKGSKSSDPRIREGVCLAVSEIVSNSSEAQREEHEDEIIVVVRRSLVDSSSNVRAAAAIAFDILQDVMGARAIDETIPTLLEALRQPGEGSGTALQALKEVMNVRASTVFPVLIPTLIATPMTAFNARALASLVTVAGNALSKRLTVILTALVRAVENETDMELKADIEGAVSALLGSISDLEGLQTLMLLLAGWVKNDSWTRRVSALNFFKTFCEVSIIDFSLYRPDWVRSLVTLMDDRQAEVVEAAVPAFEAFVKSIEKDDLDSIVVTLRRTIESTGAPGRTVPGFNIKGSVSSMVPVIVAGLTTGNNEQREQAAYAIGDLVERTEEIALKPYVVPFTGPLIRVATQATAFPPGVKVAILKSLGTMLEHIPTHVKPFFPQLSRTFVKSCSDSSSLAVRNAAAKSLGALTKSNQTRIDALVMELIGTAQASEDDAIAASLILALAYVVRHAITTTSASSKEACISMLESAFRERHDEPYLHGMATLFTSFEPSPELLQGVVRSHILQGTPPSVLSSLIILHAVEDAPKLFYTMNCVPSVLRKIVESIGESVPAISRPAREAKELIRTTPPFCDDDSVLAIFGT